MNAFPFSDETLMAHADRELDPATAASVEAAMARDPTLAARVSRFAETRRLARDAAAAFVPEEVPADLAARIRAMTRAAAATAPLPAAPPLRPAANGNHRGLRLALSALAASLLAVVAGGAGFWLGSQRAGPAGGVAVAATLAPELSRALSSLPSGQRARVGRDGGTLEVVATFRVAEATCREFELHGGATSSSLAIACLADDGWTTNFAVVTEGRESGYAPASSADAVEAYLSSVGAGDPLSAGEEEAFLDQTRR